MNPRIPSVWAINPIERAKGSRPVQANLARERAKRRIESEEYAGKPERPGKQAEILGGSTTRDRRVRALNARGFGGAGHTASNGLAAAHAQWSSTRRS